VRFWPGRPTTRVWDGLDARTATATAAALAALEAAGVTLVPVDLEVELAELVDVRVAIVPPEFTQWFGVDLPSRRAAWARALPLMGSNSRGR
jgi:hypothetical protein